MSPRSVEEKRSLISRKDSTPDSSGSSASRKTVSARIATCLFFATSSLLSAYLNKSILTTYQFPSLQVVALSHMLTTVVVLYSLKVLGKIHYPDLRSDTFADIFPLPIFALGGTLLSLSAAKLLSVSMNLMLRRFAIPLTMVAEYYMLNVRPSRSVQCSVFVILLGAYLMAADDLSFNMEGYLCVFILNILSAYCDVYMKTRLNEDLPMGKYGIMYFCSVFCTPVLLLGAYLGGDLEVTWGFPAWRDPNFTIQFFLSAVMGLMVGYSVVLCTHYNSALGVNIVACFKTALAAYLGMCVAEDGYFTWVSFLGINLSLAGSFLYAYVTLRSTGFLWETKPSGVVTCA